MKRQLDFIVGGVQKSATTWLHQCLRECQGIVLPQKKRERDFWGGPEWKDKGEDWFFSRYTSGAEGVVGDVSVDYIFNSKALPGLVERFPAVKVILSLRDPVERFVSAYFWTLRKGKLEDWALDECVDALWAGREHLGDFQKEGLPYLSALYARGAYGSQIRRLLDIVPAQNILVLNYQNIEKAPAQELVKVLGFLGVDSPLPVAVLNDRPKMNTYHGVLVGVEKRLGRLPGVAKILDRINNTVVKKKRQVDLLKEESEKRLVEMYRPEMLELKRLVEVCATSEWSRDFLATEFFVKYEASL